MQASILNDIVYDRKYKFIPKLTKDSEDIYDIVNIEKIQRLLQYIPDTEGRNKVFDKFI